MDVAKPSASLFDLGGVLSQLSAADREKVESEEFRTSCMSTFAKFVDADGNVSEDEAARAVLACVPEERQPILGLTTETAAAFLCHFGVTAAIASDVYLRIAQWAEAERALELCNGPVVPAVLPAGAGRAGVETVEQCVDRIEALAADRGVLRAGDMMWVQKIAEKCLPDTNPEGYRTCQHWAAKVVPTLLRVAAYSPNQRAPLLEACARIAAGFPGGARGRARHRREPGRAAGGAGYGRPRGTAGLRERGLPRLRGRGVAGSRAGDRALRVVRARGHLRSCAERGAERPDAALRAQ